MIWRCGSYSFDSRTPVIMGILNVTPDSFSDGGSYASVDDAVDELEDRGIDTRNIHIFYTQSLQELTTILDKIKNHEIFYEFDEDGNETDDPILDADDRGNNNLYKKVVKAYNKLMSNMKDIFEEIEDENY